jgi:hypothetical protein
LAEEFKKYIMKQAPFLFSGTQFRIIELEYYPEHFGNALMLIEDEEIRIHFVRDKDQVFIDFQAPTMRDPRKNWYHINIVKQLITGKIETSCEIVTRNIEFLRDNLEKIKEAFSASQLEDTVAKLKELQHEQSKRMFS